LRAEVEPKEVVVSTTFLGDLAAYREDRERRAAVELAGRVLPFSQAEYRERHQRLREAMSAAGVDLVLLSRPESMCWLTGYAARWYRHGGPPEWPALTTTAVRADDDRIVHFDYPGEETLSALTSVCDDVRTYPGETLDECLSFLRKELGSMGWLAGMVGRERHSAVPDQAVANSMDDALRTWGSRVCDASDLVSRLRHVKSAAEIACVEEAVRICDVGLRAAGETMAPGVTELEVWAEMIRAMTAAGGEPAALHEMVSGSPLLLYHGISSRRKLKEGDTVIVDPCGVVNRYHGNVSRCFYLGTPPPGLVELLRLGGEGYGVFCEAAGDGVEVDRVGAVIESYFRDAGIWNLEWFCGGYELGIAFPPDWVGPWTFDFARRQPGKVFAAGMVTNLEMIFEMPLVDTVVYGPDGARTLSSLPPAVIPVDV
jgi:Xaa-Pro aminopeptidase